MFRQRSFWVVAGCCLTPAILVWLGIALSNDLILCFKVKCVKESSEWFSPVVTLLQVGMAALVLWTIAYRSDQTERQIELQSSVNTFRDYLAHRDAFFELTDGLEHDEFKVYNKAKLYHQIFPDNSPQYFKPWADTGRSDVNLLGMVYDYNQLVEFVVTLRNEDLNFIDMTSRDVGSLLSRIGGVMQGMYCHDEGSVIVSLKANNDSTVMGYYPRHPDEAMFFLFELLEGVRRFSVNPDDMEGSRILPMGVLGVCHSPRFKDVMENSDGQLWS